MATAPAEPPSLDALSLDADSFTLNGKTAIVTGAAMGLGSAIALGFARFGANLALCDREAEPLDRTATAARELGAEVTTAVLDVRSGEDVANFVREVVERDGDDNRDGIV